MQYLILPLKNMILSVPYKSQDYYREYGWAHYGIDCYSNTDNTIYSSGTGIVKIAGTDSCFGNTVIIQYNDVYNRLTGKPQNFIVRYYHLSSICVSEGQAVKAEDKLGVYGATGKYVYGAHLHFEIDVDTKYYNYAPGISVNGTIIRKGTDSTIDPAHILNVGKNQKITYDNNGWCNQKDVDYPILSNNSVGKQASGDINGDGVVDIQDIVQARADIVGNSKLSDKQAMAADMDGSGTVDVQDVVKLRKKITDK